MPHVLILRIHQENSSVVVHLIFVFVLLKLALNLFAMDSEFLEALGQLDIVRTTGCHSDDVLVEIREERLYFLGSVALGVDGDEDDF